MLFAFFSLLVGLFWAIDIFGLTIICPVFILLIFFHFCVTIFFAEASAGDLGGCVTSLPVCCAGDFGYTQSVCECHVPG